MRKLNLIFVLVFLGFIALIFQNCGPNAKQIAAQMTLDSLRRVDSLAVIFKKHQQDSIVAVKEKEIKGELIWTDDKQGYFIDIRDKTKYKVVKIGDQIVMAENLAYKPPLGKYWVYDNKQENIAKYGYLYDWETAKKVAPKGWHLPTYKEWDTMFTYLGNDDTKKVFNSVKEDGDSGFNALMGGSRNDIGEFIEIGTYAIFWSATTCNEHQAWIFYCNNQKGYANFSKKDPTRKSNIVCSNSYFEEKLNANRDFGFSVRLFKD